MTEENARISELESQLQELRAEISAVKKSALVVAHELDLQKQLQQIAEQVQDLLKADTILIPILDSGCTEYTYMAGCGVNADEIVGDTIPLDLGICGWVWRNKRSWWRGVLEELEEEERNNWEKEAGTILMVPLIGKKHFLGGIAAFNKSDGSDFNKRDLELLKMFALQITSGVENAYLYQELRLLNTKLESNVIERTKELEASNKELESFCYAVSHDLRAPLRAINGFSEILQEDFSQQLDPEALECLQRVRDASQRMGQIIEDLLKLSRTTHYTLERSRIDLSAMVENIIQQKTADTCKKNFETIIADNISAYADERFVKIVLENLLGNACKYSSKETLPRIEFGSKVEDEQTVYFIKDNGVGFDMSYYDHLFTPFTRLHDGEFEGSGIGLSTVQKIIQRHGGDIWAESSKNNGATFYFTLCPAITSDPAVR